MERCGASPEGAADIPDAELRTELLGLFGIGGETADDLMLYVFSRRTFVADTYARRLFAFLGFDVPAGYPGIPQGLFAVVLDTEPQRQGFAGIPWASLTSSARPTATTRQKRVLFGWMEGLTARRIVLNKKSVRPARCQSHI